MNAISTKRLLKKVDDALLNIASRHVAFTHEVFGIHPALVPIIWNYFQAGVFIVVAFSYDATFPFVLMLVLAAVNVAGATANLAIMVPVVRDGWTRRIYMNQQAEALRERIGNYNWRFWPSLLFLVIAIITIPLLAITREFAHASVVAAVMLGYMAPYYTAACDMPNPDKGLEFGRK